MPWEYQVDEGEQITKVFEANDLKGWLEKRGNEGWELVTFQLYTTNHGNQHILLIFKRPISPKRVG